MISQIAATVIFIIMFLLIIMDKIERHVITLLCGLATLVIVFGICMHNMDAIIETINFKPIFTLDFWYHAGTASENTAGINWPTIIFIAGMMIMVEGMARTGFFRWLCMFIASKVKFKVIPILIMFMLLSGVLAMFIDSITVILFLAAVTVELAQILKFNPVPMILAEVFCANLGGSATMCGDPPNIIIGTALGYSFADFITNTGIIAFAAMIFTLIFFYFAFRNELKPKEGSEPINPSEFPNPSEMIEDKKGFIVSTIIFLIAVVMLITHAQTGLTVAFIGVFIGGITLIAAGKHAKWVLHHVDYKTLLFFVGLFIVVGGLEQTHVLELIAEFIGKISGGNLMIMIAIIIWVSGIASAFVDNIPFAATMIPVIKTLAAANGVDLETLSWALAMGTDIGGSATPIGASANVVGTSVAAKAGYPVTWGRYCKFMVPASVVVLVISTLFIWVRYL